MTKDQEQGKNILPLPILFNIILEDLTSAKAQNKEMPIVKCSTIEETISVARKIAKKTIGIVKQNIYNAASFGVPQERFRSIIIGMKTCSPIAFLSTIRRIPMPCW